MHISIIALSLLILSASASAQISVPNTFAAGDPARAADVNDNFQALVTEINALSSRVTKLEGQVTSSDLVGTYTINQFQSELGDGGHVAAYTGGGTVTLAADGTGTISGNTELGYQLSVPGGSLTAIDRPQATESFSWSLTDGTLTAFGGTFSVAVGGRLLVRTSANPVDGTNVILLLTRVN